VGWMGSEVGAPVSFHDIRDRMEILDKRDDSHLRLTLDPTPLPQSNSSTGVPPATK
jgi:hypothetical protein